MLLHRAWKIKREKYPSWKLDLKASKKKKRKEKKDGWGGTMEINKGSERAEAILFDHA